MTKMFDERRKNNKNKIKHNHSRFINKLNAGWGEWESRLKNKDINKEQSGKGGT